MRRRLRNARQQCSYTCRGTTPEDECQRFEMEVNLLLYLIFTCFVGGYAFVFGFLRKINEWLYVRKLGEKQYSLPPSDMGWPFLGKMLSFLTAFKFRDPNSFISSFVTRFLSLHVIRYSELRKVEENEIVCLNLI